MEPDKANGTQMELTEAFWGLVGALTSEDLLEIQFSKGLLAAQEGLSFWRFTLSRLKILSDKKWEEKQFLRIFVTILLFPRGYKGILFGGPKQVLKTSIYTS